MTDMPDEPDVDEERQKEKMLELLTNLKEEHRRIDIEIRALEEVGVIDVLKIRRLKKIKLSIKDKIAFLDNQLTPDIIA